MITGAHSIIYSSAEQDDIAFFKDVLKFPNVDVGHGWLIFGLPPSELAFHPAAESGLQEFYLLCDDIEAFLKEMAAHNIVCSEVKAERWGLITHITLPGGGKLGVYEPRHARP
jgi:hypothetical protein